jgi:hypothetical protein
MARRIVDTYDVPAGTNVRADVQSAIQSFADQGMLAGRDA